MAVMRKLLAGEHPVLRSLRQQLSALTVRARRHTGAGFFTEFDVAPGTAPARTASVRIGDVQARIRDLQYGAGFLLYVDHGLIGMLEAYSYEEPWPDEVEVLSIEYTDPTRSSVLSGLDTGTDGASG